MSVQPLGARSFVQIRDTQRKMINRLRGKRVDVGLQSSGPPNGLVVSTLKRGTRCNDIGDPDNGSEWSASELVRHFGAVALLAMSRAIREADRR